MVNTRFTKKELKDMEKAVLNRYNEACDDFRLQEIKRFRKLHERIVSYLEELGIQPATATIRRAGGRR